MRRSLHSALSFRQLHSFIKVFFIIFIFGGWHWQAFANQEPLIDRLKGHPASIQCDNVPVSLIFRAFGRQADINIFVDESITDVISLDMDAISLFDVFQTVIDVKQLQYTEKNNVVIVEKVTETSKIQDDFTTKRLCTKYGNADQYLDQLQTLLTTGGAISLATRGNCLLIHSTPDDILRIEQMLGELDQPIPQVHIEAQIVIVGQEAKQELGIKWGYKNFIGDAITDGNEKPILGTIDLPVSDPTTNIAFGLIKDNINLIVELQAMQEDNMLEILSAPSILVLDGKEAEISQGTEVPYTAQSGDSLNTSFREANLSLKVSPTILQNDYIVLDVFVTNDSVDQDSSTSDPLIDTQEISTNLFLENGITVVIGGIKKQKRENDKSSVPFLSSIPGLGNLFKSTDKMDQQAELLVFITPHVVHLPSEIKKNNAQHTLLEKLKKTNPIETISQ